VPRGLTPQAIDVGVDVLNRLLQRRENERARYPTDRPNHDDTASTPAPIYDAFLDARGPNGIRDLTNFSPSEFQRLWSDVQLFVQRNWNSGSGRKSTVSARDTFFMALASLKHCGSWDVVAAVFKQKSSSFSKRTTAFLAMLRPHLVAKFITSQAEKWTMLRLLTSGNKF
jgi:hypothetical protein